MLLITLLFCLLTVVAAFPGGQYPPPPSPQMDFLQNYQEKWSWFIRFADAFMYPNNTIEAAKINSTLFSENVQGRVDLTSTFDGRELNTEYVFGLFSTIAAETNPAVFNILGIPINYTVTGFTVTGNQVAASFVFWDMHVGNISLPVEVILFLRFNDEGEITQYDATFRRAEWFFDVVLADLSPLLAAQLNLTSPLSAEQLNQVLLQLSGQSVPTRFYPERTMIDEKYPSFDACLEFMRSIPFGESYELGQNTSNCRNLHQNMVPLRPSVHCPHIGPSGGGKCIPRNYIDVTTMIYFNHSFADPLALH